MTVACAVLAGCSSERAVLDSSPSGDLSLWSKWEYQVLVREDDQDTGPGAPLRGAPVRWYLDTLPFPSPDSPWRLEGEATTDENGTCLLRIPPEEGNLTVFVKLDGRWRFLDATGHSPGESTEAPEGKYKIPAEVVRRGEWCVGVVVLDGETEEPIEGAEVSRVVFDEGSPPDVWEPMTTGADGRVLFAGLGKGEWHGLVDVRRAGYAPQRNPVSFSRTEEPVYYGTWLAKGRQLRGRVVDVEGRPMEGVWVRVEHFEWPGSHYWAWWYTTDADGKFSAVLDIDARAEINLKKDGFDTTVYYVSEKQQECALVMRPGKGWAWEYLP